MLKLARKGYNCGCDDERRVFVIVGMIEMVEGWRGDEKKSGRMDI